MHPVNWSRFLSQNYTSTTSTRILADYKLKVKKFTLNILFILSNKLFLTILMTSVLRQRQLKLSNLKALSFGLQCNFLSRISKTYLWRNIGKQRGSNFSVVLLVMIFSTNYSPSCSTFADRRKNIPLLKRKGFWGVNRKKLNACKRALKESSLEKVILQKFSFMPNFSW